MKVLGADGEDSILSQTCHAFPFAMLLLCIRDIEKNLKQNFPKTFKKTKKNGFIKKISEAIYRKAIVGFESIEEYII